MIRLISSKTGPEFGLSTNQYRTAPPGWKRLLRLRSEGSSKFADVYYTSPTGAKLRSIPDVQRYLDTHPEFKQVADVRRFSFQIPRPYGRTTCVNVLLRCRHPGTGISWPSAVEPIAWAGPEENMDLQLAEPLAWAGRRGGRKRYYTVYEDTGD
ncbi:hypothetical protein OSB04_014688 [Centaurea solstitialis]|uniref:MBD domain-containing protein n=1 Tax=Centaurea solstitialis TaxID=347529 RepID=A0AA38THF5_9ASTR|nr:hypothetical protein OSB04_014688 [Centaurea solstitialis]